jgi:hypothetical protein
MAGIGPMLATRALQQVGIYLGYTGRDANVVAKAALDRCCQKSRFAGSWWPLGGQIIVLSGVERLRLEVLGSPAMPAGERLVQKRSARTLPLQQSDGTRPPRLCADRTWRPKDSPPCWASKDTSRIPRSGTGHTKSAHVQ